MFLHQCFSVGDLSISWGINVAEKHRNYYRNVVDRCYELFKFYFKLPFYILLRWNHIFQTNHYQQLQVPFVKYFPLLFSLLWSLGLTMLLSSGVAQPTFMGNAFQRRYTKLHEPIWLSRKSVNCKNRFNLYFSETQ